MGDRSPLGFIIVAVFIIAILGAVVCTVVTAGRQNVANQQHFQKTAHRCPVCGLLHAEPPDNEKPEPAK